MTTRAEIEAAFRADLQALLDKYEAELEAKDYYQGYAECGEDVRMTVFIEAVYDKNHELTREATRIDLGSWLKGTTRQGWGEAS